MKLSHKKKKVYSDIETLPRSANAEQLLFVINCNVLLCCSVMHSNYTYEISTLFVSLFAFGNKERSWSRVNIDWLFDWLFWWFTSLYRYFSHISTWEQEITNLWNRRGEISRNRFFDIKKWIFDIKYQEMGLISWYQKHRFLISRNRFLYPKNRFSDIKKYWIYNKTASHITKSYVNLW